MLAYFHNFMVYPTFFLFRMPLWHVMHLTSLKIHLVHNTVFFLRQPLEYLYPISLNGQNLINITNKYFFRKRLKIINRFIWTAYLSFEKTTRKWRNLELNNYCTSHVYQYGTSVNVVGNFHITCRRCWVIYFWTWNNFVLLCFIFKFNIHNTRLHILKKMMKTSYPCYDTYCDV